MRIPTQLRPLTGGSAEVDAPAGRVAEVIDHLDGAYPGLRERLLDADGGLRRFVNVYVGEDDVRFLDGLATSVPEGSAVSIIPAVAGG
ncbi:MAG TPA: MoaD/ThiS family protein [Actinomycetota bacterium]|nr:MoaD/ThiS family protein [Actinomycetota bacterium]